MRALRHFLASAFSSPEDFARLVEESDGFGLGRERLRLELPLGAPNMGAYIERFVRMLDEQQRLNSPELFAALVLARPGRRAEIIEIARQHGIAPGLLPGVAGVARATIRATGRWGWFFAGAISASLAGAAIDLVPGGGSGAAPRPMQVESLGEETAPAPRPSGLLADALPQPADAGPPAPEEELFVIDDPVSGAPVGRRPLRRADPGRDAAGRELPPETMVRPSRPPPLPAPTGRCELAVAPHLQRMVPDIDRQRRKSGDPSRELRAFIKVSADGRTMAVQTDTVWEMTGRSIVAALQDSVFAPANATWSCNCRIDFTARRATCSPH